MKKLFTILCLGFVMNFSNQAFADDEDEYQEPAAVDAMGNVTGGAGEEKQFDAKTFEQLKSDAGGWEDLKPIEALKYRSNMEHMQTMKSHHLMLDSETYSKAHRDLLNDPKIQQMLEQNKNYKRQPASEEENDE